MALEWDDKYENEEELNKLTGVQLRVLYRNAPDDKKSLVAKVASEKLVDLEKEIKQSTPYDVLAEVNVVSDYNENTQEDDKKLPVDYSNIYSTVNDYFQRYEGSSENLELVENLSTKSLIEILKVSAAKLGDEIKNSDSFRIIEAANGTLNQKIENQLSNQTEYSPEAEKHFYLADHSGALDDVSQDAKDKFIDFIAQNTGWKEATQDSIVNADKILNDNILSLDIYIEQNGQKVLNPIYDECAELANSIKYEFAADTDEATKQSLTQAYNQQLMANAMQRATQDVLRNPSLLGDNKTKEEVAARFKKLIGDNFSRSVVVAGLASSLNTTEGLEINSETGRVYYEENDEPLSIIEDIKSGKTAISPAAVNLDSYQLGIETTRTEKMLNLKKVSKDKVPFFNKAKMFVKAAYENIVKKGGWKKIATNVVMFGGAAAAMASGATGVIVAGSAVYAGWTAANAWVAPVWDKLSAEMDKKGIKGFKNKWSYRIKNWKRAKTEKYNEADFKKRATMRTVEGVTIGGVSGALGLGGAGSWIKTLARQGTMIVGKGASLTRSLFKRKSAAEKLSEQYSVANYNTLQTAENYLRQDKVALAAVVGGSLLSDIIKLEAGNIDASGLDSETVTPELENKIDTSGLESKLEQIKEKITSLWSSKDNPQETPQAEAQGTPSDVDNSVPASEEQAVVASESQVEKIDINDLSNDEKKMFLNSHKKWENTDINKFYNRFEKEGYEVSGNFISCYEGRVQDFYNEILSGRVETCPEGMSPVEYVDKLTRLMQLAPVQQKKGIELMLRDLMCPKFSPTEADKNAVAEALDTIRYDKGTSQCIMRDENGGLCLKTMPNFGNYYGPQQVIELELDGKTVQVPVRNANVTVALDTEVSCSDGTAKIASVYVVNKVDCGCPQPEPEPELVPYVNEKSSGEQIAFDGEKDVMVAKEQVTVDMQDPQARGTAIKSGKSDYYDVDVTTVNGKAKAFADGHLQVWDKDGVRVTEEGYENVMSSGHRGTQVDVQMPENVEGMVAKLPELPTNVTRGEDGSIIYEYKFEQGNDVKVVIDAPTEEGAKQIGHLFVGEKEVIVDKASAEALMDKMSEKTNLEFVSSDGQEQTLSSKIEITERIQKRIDKYYGNKSEDMGNPIASEDSASFTQREVTNEAVSLSADQKAKIMYNQSELKCLGIRDGKAILEVKGVEGVNRIAVATPTHVDIDATSQAPQATVGENGNYSVSIATADKKELLVTIADGKAKTTLDGKPVILDTESCRATQEAVKGALLEKNVIMNITLHTRFTEKVVRAVENATSSTTGAKVIPQVVSNSTGR